LLKQTPWERSGHNRSQMGSQYTAFKKYLPAPCGMQDNGWNK